jgi:putative ABC transport system ATP-binding protein
MWSWRHRRAQDNSPEGPLIILRDVWRVFAGNPPIEALRAVNLTVERGEYLAIIGPSGSGKSTLLNILGCLDRPTNGSVVIDGLDTSSLGDAARSAFRGQQIGFVFQSFQLLSHRDVVENVMLAELYTGAARRSRRARAVAALEEVGLAHRLAFRPTRLSGGERQRVAIARALVGRPPLLLCDEPTGNLDTRNGLSVLGIFDRLHAAGLTILVITHDAAVSARARRVVRIVDGELREESFRP